MLDINGIQMNGAQDSTKPTSYFYEHTVTNGAPASINGESNGIPPADAYNNVEHVENVTIPLNNVPAFTPQRKLRIVTIGAGYAGMTLAQKIQHKYAKEMEKYAVEHVIFESKTSPGGTWIANTYPGVMCDVPSAIYVSYYCTFVNLGATHSALGVPL